MKTTSHPFVGAAIAIVPANLFSSKVLLVKLAFLEGATPLQILAIRMAVALPFFAVLALVLLSQSKGLRPRGWDYAGMTALGMVGYYLSSLLDFHGMVYLTSGMERLLLYLYPTFVILLRSVFERSLPKAHEVGALILAYVGIGLVYHDERLVANGDILPGVLMVIGSAVCFANYLYFSGRYINKFGARLYASYSTSISCVAIIFHCLVVGELGTVQLSFNVILLGVALGIFCTVLPTYAMHQAISMIGSARVGILGASGIICPLLLGVALFGEPLTLYRIMGTVLVLLAVICLNLKRAKPK